MLATESRNKKEKYSLSKWQLCKPLCGDIFIIYIMISYLTGNIRRLYSLFFMPKNVLEHT